MTLAPSSKYCCNGVDLSCKHRQHCPQSSSVTCTAARLVTAALWPCSVCRQASVVCRAFASLVHNLMVASAEHVAKKLAVGAHGMTVAAAAMWGGGCQGNRQAAVTRPACLPSTLRAAEP